MSSSPRRSGSSGRRTFGCSVGAWSLVCRVASGARPHTRAQRTGGQLSLLYVIEPDVDFQWLAVEDVAREEGHNKAKAVFRLFGRKLKAMGFEQLVPEEVVREGIKAEEITKLIEEDADVGLLVLGASKDPSGPGPLVLTLASGRPAGTFPVPITVVPGHLSIEEILALA